MKQFHDGSGDNVAGDKIINIKWNLPKWIILSLFIVVGGGGILFSTIKKDENNLLSSASNQLSDEQRAKMLLVLSYAEGSINKDELIKYIEEVSAVENKLEFLNGLNFIDTTLISHDLSNQNIDDFYTRDVKTGSQNGGLELTNPENESETIEVRNCRDFYKYMDKGYYAMTTYDMKDESYFNQTCDIIRAIEKIKPAKVSFMEKIGIIDLEYWSGDIISFLGPEEDYPNYDETSIKELVESGEFKIRKTTSNSIQWEFGGNGQYIAELLKGDLNDDGIEDMLIFNYIYSVEGTFGYGFTQKWTKKKEAKYFELIE